jgi:hypothetical protein
LLALLIALLPGLGLPLVRIAAARTRLTVLCRSLLLVAAAFTALLASLHVLFVSSTLGSHSHFLLKFEFSDSFMRNPFIERRGAASVPLNFALVADVTGLTPRHGTSALRAWTSVVLALETLLLIVPI